MRRRNRGEGYRRKRHATADPPASVVACRNADFHFGQGETRKQILFGVSFDIRAGEVVLLIGPSGSGNTTLLTLIGALRAIPHGELTVLGHPLYSIAKSELSVVRRRIGFIFQSHNLLNFLTVRPNVDPEIWPPPREANPTCHRNHLPNNRLRRSLLWGLPTFLDTVAIDLDNSQRLVLPKTKPLARHVQRPTATRQSSSPFAIMLLRKRRPDFS